MTDVPGRWLMLPLLAACGRLGYEPQPGDAVGAASYAEVVLADHPIAYFRLEDLDTIADDSSGNGNDSPYVTPGPRPGTYAQGLAGALSHEPNAASRFDGDGVVGDADEAWVWTPSLVPVFAGDFSIELFFKATVAGDRQRGFFICEDYLMNGFRTGLVNAQIPAIWTDDGAGASRIIASSGAVPAEQWLHFVATRAGASVRLYVDGQLVGADDALSYVIPDAASPCGFGVFHGVPGHSMFDEVAIYDVALTAAQVAAHVAAR